jgi:hypothetical protein
VDPADQVFLALRAKNISFANWHCFFGAAAAAAAESMVSTRQQKQALAAVSNPLRDAGILERVFTFLPGCWLFLGAVCREWRSVYAGLADQQKLCIDVQGHPARWLRYGAKTTLFSAVVASPATVRLAATGSAGPIGVCANDNLQQAAGLYADIDTLSSLRELGMPLGDILVRAAALSGRLKILQHLIVEQQCPKTDVLVEFAARSGSIDMLKWLRDVCECVFDQDTCAAAAIGGQLAALQHLRTEGCEWDADRIVGYAAFSGSIEVVEWLRQQQGVEVNAYTMTVAAGVDIAMCKHLRSVGCDWDGAACTQAAKCGHINKLRWLRESGCPWDVRDMCLAGIDFSSILDYIIEQGEVLDVELLTEALNCAGAHGQAHAAEWYRQHGAQWPAVLSYGEEPNVLQWSDSAVA